MTPERTVAVLDALAWTLIFAGLFMVVFGFVFARASATAGWTVGLLGAAAVVAGVVLVWIRSRTSETGAGGAQSGTPSQETRK